MPFAFIPRKRSAMAGHTADIPKPMQALLRKHAQDANLNYNAIERQVAAGQPMFHFRGPITVSTSDSYPVGAGSTISRVCIGLTTAGTTTTTIVIKLDGATIITVTMASGVTRFDSLYHIAVTSTAILAVGVTVVGTGAAGLVAVVTLT